MVVPGALLRLLNLQLHEVGVDSLGPAPHLGLGVQREDEVVGDLAVCVWRSRVGV